MNSNELTELLVAAHVRELAIGLRKKAAVRQRDDDPNPMAGQLEYIAAFEQRHAVTEFVPEAVEALREIARVMKG